MRAAAAALALVALVDPSWPVNRPVPLSVEVRTADSSYAALAGEVRRRLASREDVQLESAEEPRVMVVVGDSVSAEAIPASIPVSIVRRPDSPNVRVQELTATAAAIPGWTMPVRASIEARGMAGLTSHIVLEHQGVQLRQLQHRWSRDRETLNARFDYVPPTAGTSTLRVVAKPLESEATADDNHADAQIAIEDRKLRVLFFEPRPSWATAFVRRTLEQTAFFDVQTLARSSRGIEARTSSAPRNLSTQTLEPFEAIVVGAPEELRTADLDAIERFVSTRGGAVVLIPDRRPSSSYAQLLPVARVDEVLTEKPAALQGVSPGLKCSESIVLTDPVAGVDVLATLPRQSGAVPAIVSWPQGAGRVVYSGCLDAWRYRSDGNAFARFWTAQIARAAADAPRRIEVSVAPVPATPGREIRVNARIRRTEFSLHAATVELPSISARVTDPRGVLVPLRLWPASEPGMFEGSFKAFAEGRHLVEVFLEDPAGSQRPGARGQASALVVKEGVRTSEYGATESLRAVAAASGGVLVTGNDLSPLEHHLAGVARAVTPAAVHPARSPAWAVAFIVLLSGEWWLRRREGRV